MDPGKVDRAFFDAHIRDRLGAPRADVELGPTYGADFGVIRVGEHVLALATDPVFVLRDLGLERAAWFAVHIVLSDVALSGLPPSHLSVDFNLPPDTDPQTFADIWTVFDREARELGVNIVTGHTGVYAGTGFPTVGGATGLAVGRPEDLVLPTGAEPGDLLLVTKGPAIETTGILATVFGDHLDLPPDALQAARERFWDASPIQDALVAAAAGPVTAMHDATEGGLANALHELAGASEVGLAVESDRIPMLDGVEALCEAFAIDPLRSSSEGTVLLTVAAHGEDAILDALADEEIPAAVVGEVTSGTAVTLDGEPLDEPAVDPFWGAYERARERFGPVDRPD